MSATALAAKMAPGALSPRLRRPAALRLAPASEAPSGELAGLAGQGTSVTRRRGEALFFEGDPADAYFKVMRGAVRTCRLLPDGRRHIGQFLLTGDVFGLVPGASYPYAAEAVTDTVLIRYPRRQIEHLMIERPEIGRSLCTVASRQLAAAQQQMVLLGRKTAEERIASFLLMMAERCGDGHCLALPMTRADVADYLGLTIETVSRTVSQLRHDGLIALHGASEVTILDHEALQDMAEGG